jgi:hypothetical protein
VYFAASGSAKVAAVTRWLKIALAIHSAPTRAAATLGNPQLFVMIMAAGRCARWTAWKIKRKSGGRHCVSHTVEASCVLCHELPMAACKSSIAQYTVGLASALPHVFSTQENQRETAKPTEPPFGAL